MRLFVVFTVIFSLGTATGASDFQSPWTFECENQKTPEARCVRKELNGGNTAQTLNYCKLTCGVHSSLWPYPTTTETLGNEVSRFTVFKITHSESTPNAAIEALLTESISIFLNNLDMYHPDYDFINHTAPWTEPSDPDIANHALSIQVNVAGEDEWLTLSTNESYSLDIVPAADVTTAVIVASTFFGARHGLESLSQLINYDEQNDCLQMLNTAVITNDVPTFPYRGLAIDTARNYLSVQDLERTLDGMAANKLNTLHWHLTDTQSFPVVLESLPKMHQYGAYSARQLYTAEDISRVIKYGQVRGIRILPEFDAPAHVGNGWQWGPQDNLGDLIVCLDKEPWATYCVEPPCGQFNIANENMYDVLGKVYQEYVSLFSPMDLFHFGGDEINVACWNSSEEIREWMQTVGNKSLTEDDYYQQWSEFQKKALDLLVTANGGTEIPGIIWTSSLTEVGKAEEYLDKDKYIVQIWTAKEDPQIPSLLQQGFRVIFSNYNSSYLDCGFGAWVGEGNNWCAPYIGWQKIYDNSPYEIAGDEKYYSQIMGGEAALWSEEVDGQSLDSKLWPRGAALAERLWSNPMSGSWEDAEYRMVHHRQRLVQRGLTADRLQPEWCHQHEGSCYK